MSYHSGCGHGLFLRDLWIFRIGSPSAGDRLGRAKWLRRFSRQSRLAECWFSFLNQMGEPLHAAGHQWRRRFIHRLDGSPHRACRSLRSETWAAAPETARWLTRRLHRIWQAADKGGATMMPRRPKASARAIRMTMVRMGLSHLRLKRRGLTHTPRQSRRRGIESRKQASCTLVSSPTKSGESAPPGAPQPRVSGMPERRSAPGAPGMGTRAASNPGPIAARPGDFGGPRCVCKRRGLARLSAKYHAPVCAAQVEAARARVVQNGFD
jgi:hypothetical protein